jgi:hypothetical protein
MESLGAHVLDTAQQGVVHFDVFKHLQTRSRVKGTGGILTKKCLVRLMNAFWGPVIRSRPISMKAFSRVTDEA